ncbi:unnamed protein product [Caenorhabditis angaria]|uniref:Uncharacterized protein n=1 Tax=Caenorhabditis angaria TaxID=860376 RepID=A0A9P1IQR9_9PELO|nr:unnamed protein product [Caenorhabditis angaria]
MSDEIQDSDTFLKFVLYSSILAVFLYFIRRYLKGGQFTERVSAKNLIAVVTGANCGIGFETVKELNLRKAKVYMLCRSEKNALAAKIQLAKRGCDSSRLNFIQCDFTSLDSVRNAARELLRVETHIDILVNNAAVLMTKFEVTEDGFEKTWQTNHLGPFLLTELLLPALKKSENGGRIVNVSALIHKKVKKLDYEKINEKKHFGDWKCYGESKVANILHARQLTRRLHKSGSPVTINSLHPGIVNTDLLRNTIFAKPVIISIARFLANIFLKTPLDGAQTVLHVALSKKLEGVSGKYFVDCKLAAESEFASNDQASEDLYNYSIEKVSKFL